MTKKPHIVIVVPGFPENEQDTSCIPLVQLLIRAIDFAEITVLTVHYPLKAGKYKWHGMDVYSLGGQNIGGWRKVLLWRKGTQLLEEIHRKNPIDRIHAFWLSDAFVIGKKIARAHKIPFSCTMMGQEPNTARRYARLVDGKDRFIALSTFHKHEIRNKLKISVEKVIPFGKTSSEQTGSSRTIDILGVGSLISLKNYEAFIRVIGRISEIRSVKAVILGGGPDFDKLNRLITSLGLNEIIDLKGAVSREEVLKTMEESKVFFHPSIFESLGYVFVEAAERGLKVVSYPIGLASDVNNKDWIVVESEDHFDQAILQLLDTEHTSDLAKSLPTMKEIASDYKTFWKIH